MMRDENENCVTHFGGSLSCRIKERSLHGLDPDCRPQTDVIPQNSFWCFRERISSGSEPQVAARIVSFSSWHRSGVVFVADRTMGRRLGAGLSPRRSVFDHRPVGLCVWTKCHWDWFFSEHFVFPCR